MKDKIAAARIYILEGRSEEATKLLDRLQRKNKIEGDDRIAISGLFRSLGRPDKALKVLGPLILAQETTELSEYELNLAIVQARLLNSLGCKFLAARLFEGVASFLAGCKKHYGGGQLLFFYNYFANVLVEKGQLDQAFKMAKKFGEKIDHAAPELLNITNARAFYHDLCGRIAYYQGDMALAHRHLDEQEKIILPNEVYWTVNNLNRRATFYLYTHELEKVHEYLQKSGEILKQHPGAFIIEEFFWFKQMAVYLIERQDLTMAASFLQSMALRARKLEYSPEHFISGIFHMEKIDPDSLTFGEKIALRCHPLSNFYSYMAGRSLGGRNIEELPKWCQKKLPTQNNNNCWIVQNQSISPTVYRQHRSRLLDCIKNDTHSLLDLVSGIVQSEKGQTILSEVQHRVLIAVCGAADFGIDKWSLMEFVYRQTFIDVQVGLDRLSKVIQSLRKLGFDIKLENNNYLYSLTEHEEVIMPMIWHAIGIWNILKNDQGKIEKELMKSHFALKNSTLKSWVSEWKKKGIAA